MNISAIQLVQPRGVAQTGFVVRLGRLAILYTAIAITGATVVLVAFLLTWHNLAIAVVGLVAGLGTIHSVAALLDVLTLLVRHMKTEFRALSRIGADLRVESRAMLREFGTQHFRDDDTQPFRTRGSLLRRNVLKYASLTAMIAPLFVVLGHASSVFVWSGMSGLVFGIVVIMVDRVIFHIHGFSFRRDRRRTDVTTPR